jgi:AraC-like DNA-binding protein
VDGARHRDEVHQRANALSALPEVLRELGIAPGPVFAGTGVDPDAMTAETRIPFGALTDLLERAVAATGRADLGLTAGPAVRAGAPRRDRRADADRADAGGCAEGVHAVAARLFERAVVYVHSEGGMTAFGSAVCSASVRPGRAYTDLVLAIGVRMVALLTGGSVRLAEAQVTHRRPADTALYARVVGAPVRFGGPLTSLFLPTEAMSVPLPGRDALRHAVIGAEIAAARRGRGPALETLVRGALRKLILVAKPTMEEVAEELALHPRTLRRRLKADGFVFEELRDEVRLASALELLELTDLPVGDVAAALSYASPEVFSEAFRRMRGVSPRAWRARHARGR